MSESQKKLLAMMTADCDQKAEVITDWLASHDDQGLEAIASVFIALANASCGIERMAILASLNDFQLSVYTMIAAVGLEHFHQRMLSKEEAIREFED